MANQQGFLAKDLLSVSVSVSVSAQLFWLCGSLLSVAQPGAKWSSYFVYFIHIN